MEGVFATEDRYYLIIFLPIFFCSLPVTYTHWYYLQILQNRNLDNRKVKCKKEMIEVLPSTTLHPRSLMFEYMVTSTGRHITNFGVYLASCGMYRKFLAHPTLALHKWPLYCTDISSQNQVGRIFPMCLLLFKQNALRNWWCHCPHMARARQTSRALLEHQDGMSHWLGNGDNLGTGSDLCWSASLLPRTMAGKWAPWPTERTVCSLSSWLQGGKQC